MNYFTACGVAENAGEENAGVEKAGAIDSVWKAVETDNYKKRTEGRRDGKKRGKERKEMEGLERRGLSLNFP